MDIYVWILSFLIIFMLHNLEEIITIERWFEKTYPRVSRKIPSAVQKELKNYEDTTSAQFSVVVFVFSVFCLCIDRDSCNHTTVLFVFGGKPIFCFKYFHPPITGFVLKVLHSRAVDNTFTDYPLL